MRRAGTVLTALVLLAAALVSAPAPAQILRPWYWGGGWGGNYGGGTAAGNYMQGMSEVIRSEGEYNLATSQAGVNNEEARSRYLDNYKKWQQNYFQLKEQRAARDAQKREASRHSPETIAAAGKSSASRPLSSESLDPVTGQIIWPEVLRGGEFASLRTEVEKLFELRAKTSHTEATGLKIHSAIDEMTKVLRRQVETTPANEYMAGRKFLDSLDRTVRS